MKLNEKDVTIQNGWKELKNSRTFKTVGFAFVIPAKAGIQLPSALKKNPWTPASAGVTDTTYNGNMEGFGLPLSIQTRYGERS